MNFTKILRKIPIVKEKMKTLKPQIEDILFTFFNSNDKLTFMDVGANSGQTIEFVNRIFRNATIYSFEPTSTLVTDLKRKYGHSKQIHIEQLALSDNNGQIEFYQSEFSPTNSCLEPNAAIYEKFNQPLAATLANSSKISVPCMKLDDWYNTKQDIDIIDIVKIDTQGFEYNVIKGGIETLKNHVKLLYFEIQYLEFYKDATPFYKTFELLYENGFYFYCYLSSNKNSKYQLIESDVLFVNRKFFSI